MTPLADLLARRIEAGGPITLAEYMADCLLHPEHGYYSTRDPFGRGGDFTTAPEISQMFGELLGLALAQAWLDQGSPTPFVLAEIGPGRGTLMADVLRTLRAVPGMFAAARVHLVEASATLRARQRETLADQQVTWHDGIDTLPEAPLLLLANEFFDALPIRQFVRADPGWCERLVGLSPEGALQPGLSTPAPLAALAHRLADTKEGDVVEICPAAPAIAAAIAARIARHGGAALIVDYGGWHSLGDTFQAVQDHATADPFAAPGEADLTAHVDFEPLAAAARGAGAAASALVPQGVLLERLGIAARAERLAQGLSGPALESHLAAHRRLTHPGEMGRVFKALAIHPQHHSPPPGFEPSA
ncbi:class I SAM-dependent methyltransferase [Frigidibacter albus]|uniref:Class I SAM-dependent methyltransferase n=1 Tax=Frigidibacter albus TaxID=1465486 RepID=A0A6L8VIC0_9RHOB|nr:SAM-dependent methyltransferase [Frigidibacter albus]MZQ88930.1 class I SAM-dependent methyltransferase [Frigidibacter albus]NBE31013.1 class I SAM-dependent methyltransferase [Frigidibacter albus]GGH52372.1 ATP synthase subunit beta [Frigidibacter albus]